VRERAHMSRNVKRHNAQIDDAKIRSPVDNQVLVDDSVVISWTDLCSTDRVISVVRGRKIKNTKNRKTDSVLTLFGPCFQCNLPALVQSVLEVQVQPPTRYTLIAREFSRVLEGIERREGDRIYRLRLANLRVTKRSQQVWRVRKQATIETCIEDRYWGTLLDLSRRCGSILARTISTKKDP